MYTLKILFICLCILYLLFYTYAAIKTKKPLKTIFLQAKIGLLFLLIINLTTRFTNVFININLYTVVGICATSLPGVIMLLILNLFFVI